jgi:CreA protein
VGPSSVGDAGGLGAAVALASRYRETECSRLREHGVQAHQSYDDPKIDGITVFISKSQTGGIKGALGLAEDTSDASVAVRQTGPIKVKEKFDSGEDAFTEKRSVLFKRLHVSRFWDAPHKSFVYVVWTDRFINGSPQNSISAVVAEPWGTQAPDLSLMESVAPAPPQ